MSNTADLEHRLTELEIKLGFMDDLVDHLNHLVVRQQDQIDLLLHEVHRLRQQHAETAAPVFRSLRDEIPPHY